LGIKKFDKTDNISFLPGFYEITANLTEREKMHLCRNITKYRI